jgi:Ca2+-transporting ATPase
MDTASNLQDGLSEREAAARLARFGPNRLKEKKVRGFVDVARQTLHEPMFLLLLVAASRYLVFGDLGEGLFLLVGALLSLGLVIVQELRSERALAALNAMAEPVARVIREGRERSIPATGLVPGDLIIVGEGGRLPADATLVGGDALLADESALTGESVAVQKSPGTALPDADPVPGEAVGPHLFAGTLVVRGQGLALVRSTGLATRVGRIGSALADAVEAPTLIQRDIRRLISRLGLLALLFCLVVALAYGAVRGDWFQGALTGLTLAISLIPEEFPMVLAIFMALGAWRLARHNVLVRRSAVIETLGATTLLCVDKTGTLTENRMAVQCVWRQDRLYDLGEGVKAEAEPVIVAAQLASAVRPHDPMDAAIHLIAGRQPPLAPLRSYPLKPEFLAFVQVWPSGEDGGTVYAAKGAPETILRLCEEDPDATRQAEAAVDRLAARGMRVLAVAEARFPFDPGRDPAGLRYRLQGLLGFVDPVRSDVPAALAEAQRAGISVAMITGDYPETALAAARAAGIDTGGGVVAGKDLGEDGKLSADQLKARVFARIMPEQKLRLVQGFRQAGQVVAMTGDGINDAPALAAADIGIAMGRHGTDVAREASDLILLDDRFASIVGGIRLGRRIFANLRRAMIYIAAIHVPVAGLALLPLLLGLPPLLYPMHLVLLELLIDPICSLVFEGEPSEEKAMRLPPRRASEPLFGLPQLALSSVQGGVLLAGVLGLYAWTLHSGAAENEARTSAFVALVVGQLILALAEAEAGALALGGRHRIAFWSIAGAALLAMTVAITLPPLPSILRFAPASGSLLLIAIATGLLAGGWYGLAKGLARPDPR